MATIATLRRRVRRLEEQQVLSVDAERTWGTRYVTAALELCAALDARAEEVKARAAARRASALLRRAVRDAAEEERWRGSRAYAIHREQAEEYLARKAAGLVWEASGSRPLVAYPAL